MVEPWDVQSPNVEKQIDTLLGQLRLCSTVGTDGISVGSGR
jgi:hypothetical protein